MKYDLEERTTTFGEAIISFCKNLPQGGIAAASINQLVRAGTSIGANYAEAIGASSKKDFRNKIFICKKESQETKFWIRMCASLFPDRKKALAALWREAQELTLIFQKITSSLKNPG